jgi:hypothetical protein
MVPVIAFAIATGGASSIALVVGEVVGGGAVIVAVGYKTYRYFFAGDEKKAVPPPPQYVKNVPQDMQEVVVNLIQAQATFNQNTAMVFTDAKNNTDEISAAFKDIHIAALGANKVLNGMCSFFQKNPEIFVNAALIRQIEQLRVENKKLKMALSHEVDALAKGAYEY